MNHIRFAGIKAHDQELERLLSTHFEDKPEFVITDIVTDQNLTKEICDLQMKSMIFFAKIEEGQIATNSVQAPAIMKFNDIVKDVTYDGCMCAINLKSECDQELVAETIAGAMEEQMKDDTKQLFLRDIDNDTINDDRLQEAQAGERQCHDESEAVTNEIAWDDVNDCPLDPVQVRQARRSEIEFSKRMQVYKKVQRQNCRDTFGRSPIQVRWVDTNKHGENNPKYRSRLVAKGFKP